MGEASDELINSWNRGFGQLELSADVDEQLPLRINERPNLADAGFVHAHAGDRAQALAEIERIERIGREGFGVAYDVAIIRAALGDVAEGCAALARATSDHSLTVMWMRTDPRMDPLRGQPCFHDAEQKLFGP